MKLGQRLQMQRGFHLGHCSGQFNHKDIFMFGVAQVVQASCKIVAETCLGRAILGRNAGNSVGVHIAVPLCVCFYVLNLASLLE